MVKRGDIERCVREAGPIHGIDRPINMLLRDVIRPMLAQTFVEGVRAGAEMTVSRLPLPDLAELARQHAANKTNELIAQDS